MQESKSHSLPQGYRLQEYRIDKLLSGGGFSYVYLAHNQQGERVAIKEYLPIGLAVRIEGERVEANAPENLINFRHGLKCFFEEGRSLARINHNNIVRVLNFFRANDTVYMVMQYERGKSLQEYIQSHAMPAKEAFVRRLFSEMLNGLREVHASKLLHLDIKPANIYIRLDGSPVLLDFGSARQTLANEHAKLPLSFTPGFASPEQYTNRKLLGPWSDIYSVGASLYSCLARSSPLAADIRQQHDTLAPATQIGRGVYSDHLLEIIDWCMKIDPLLRPQSVFTLQKALLEPPPEDKSLLASIRRKLRL
ncbi:serine/threonine-protein kinase D [mine drainage metagenome]|uniref:Serine/threonine-protein kinase D n=1 Tax=mine drainage metagenome TaxID=410659 RepID=A0A1J5R2L1_9ZZZZ